MFRWFKQQPSTVKWMIAIIVLALLGIILRWDYIRSEAGEAFRSRFGRTPVQSESVED